MLFSFIILAHISTLAVDFISGHELCTRTKTKRPGEIGYFIKAPVKSASSQTTSFTEIYFWTYLEFDKQKPSMIYVNGGPGGSSHFSKIIGMKDWNIIFFDQRGTACSRPTTFTDYKNTNYLSSQIIAEDMDLIRQHLQIQKWSIYGHSYGTVPATLYAHLFPQNTTALVLEGVIDRGDSDLYRTPRRKFLTQQFVNQLDEALKDKIDKIATSWGIDYFSKLLMSLMYADLPFANVEDYLKKIVIQNEVEASENSALFLSQKVTTQIPPNPNIEVTSTEDLDNDWNSLLGFSEPNWTIITCKELRSNQIESYFFYEWLERKFHFVNNESAWKQRLQSCYNLNITDEMMQTPYDAANLRLQVPTTYFQGTTDGSTEAPKAVRHFKTNTSSNKQIFLKINGGHSPMINPLFVLSTDKETLNANQLATSQIFRKALRGEKIEVSELATVGTKPEKKLIWVGTHKGF